MKEKNFYEMFLRDVEIAEEYLRKTLLLRGDLSVICDIYAVPSHNYQTFYGKICQTNQRYELNYAKPIIYVQSLDQAIYMYSFQDAITACNQALMLGKIICGRKPIEAAYISKLQLVKDLLKEGVTLAGVKGLRLDGELQAIRFYEGCTIKKEVCYEDKNELTLVKENEEAKRILGEMYFKIHQMIWTEVSV